MAKAGTKKGQGTGGRKASKAGKKPAKTSKVAPDTDENQTRLEDARARMYSDLVFESAECVFGRNGFEAATMKDVASEAGISLKTLYGVVDGKQDLFDEIQRVRGRAFVERLGAASDLEGDALERLGAFVSAYTAFLFEHRDWLQIHIRSRVSWGLPPTTGEAVDHWERNLDNVSAILEEGIASGLFFEADPRATSALVQSMMQVLVNQAVARDESDSEAVAAEIMLQLRRLLCPDGGPVRKPEKRAASG